MHMMSGRDCWQYWKRKEREGDENENQKIRDYFIGNNYYSYQYGSLCK